MLTTVGYHVIATARRVETLEEFAKQGMTTIALDVTQAESIASCKAQVDKLTGGKLDILVNNACVPEPRFPCPQFVSRIPSQG